ncbi:ubiquinol-cytochrome c reductase cytochrome b subunit [Diaminobutyricimonas aerilata]|uniref:Cytochrome bc1 complex cytochrome b subunit n=1 Tax=Diaminobutyricimonas aerilata TaxID=1162967 RepID=A0A2M9CNG4_9MICO|nr:cytochrome b N-terminal domain-containing protein [Diaminobutyricimonas aerilata]PJJ73422.1 ubiquinol-cytochrome c reductase cytochrome b subunit [Diaminobutyricimonas aerilata]
MDHTAKRNGASASRATSWLQQRPAVQKLRDALSRNGERPRWSTMFWPVAVASFVVVVITGFYLTAFYDPSIEQTRYDGDYAPLRGTEMSRALESTLGITFDVPGGLFARQLHGWASSLMIAALLVHLLALFFTGRYRKPARMTWVFVFVVLFLSMAGGLTGVVLPDDLVSGSSLAVLDGVTKAVPVVGTWLSFLIFQGQGTSGAIGLFYPLHVFALPLAIAGAIAFVVLGALRVPERLPRWKATGWALAATATRRAPLFFLVAATLTIVSAAVTINPVWIYGPADPGNAAAGAGALWYLAFLDGAQRLMPPGWEIVWLDRTWTLAILVPVGVAGLFLVVALMYPFIESVLTGDRRDHVAPERPRNVPTRTATGVAGMVFYGVLWAAAASDVIAAQLQLGLENVVHALQLTLLIGPVVAFLLTKRICLDLQAKDRELLRHGRETGRIVRLPGGEYIEVHAPIDDDERRALSSVPVGPTVVRPGPDGRIRVSTRVHAVASRWFSDGAATPAADDARPVELERTGTRSDAR